MDLYLWLFCPKPRKTPQNPVESSLGRAASVRDVACVMLTHASEVDGAFADLMAERHLYYSVAKLSTHEIDYCAFTHSPISAINPSRRRFPSSAFFPFVSRLRSLRSARSSSTFFSLMVLGKGSERERNPASFLALPLTITREILAS